MGRAPCCDKSKVKRGPWSPEEDTTLRNYVEKHGTSGSWIALPQKAGLKRCGKSCRLRWLNYLRPNLKHGGFTQQEDTIILTLYHSIGSRWSVIASQLPGRTDNDVKNYWNTKLKKKLFATNPLAAAASTTAAAAASNFISTTNGDTEAAYSGNSESNMSPYFPFDANFNQEILGNVENAHHFSLLPSAPASLSPPFSADIIHSNANASTVLSCEDDDALLVELGRELMPYDLLNAFDFNEKFNHQINHLSFGYSSPSNISNAGQELPIYQSFTY